MIASAAKCGAATADSRQKPMAARPATRVVAEGPGFGAGAMGETQHDPAQCKALTGEDQETHDTSGTCVAS
jgi:hypothetical protein